MMGMCVCASMQDSALLLEEPCCEKHVTQQYSVWDSWLHSRTNPLSHRGVEIRSSVLADVLEPQL